MYIVHHVDIRCVVLKVSFWKPNELLIHRSSLIHLDLAEAIGGGLVSLISWNGCTGAVRESILTRSRCVLSTVRSCMPMNASRLCPLMKNSYEASLLQARTVFIMSKGDSCSIIVFILVGCGGGRWSSCFHDPWRARSDHLGVQLAFQVLMLLELSELVHDERIVAEIQTLIMLSRLVE